VKTLFLRDKDCILEPFYIIASQAVREKWSKTLPESFAVSEWLEVGTGRIHHGRPEFSIQSMYPTSQARTPK
jgi:hypothetical protein